MRTVDALILLSLAMAMGCKAPEDVVDVGDAPITRTGSTVLPANGGNCPQTPHSLPLNPPVPVGSNGIHLPAAGKPVRAAIPEYPICGDIRRTPGVVDIEFTLEPDGSVADPHVLQELPAGFGFADALLKVFPRWTFTPKVVMGKAAATEAHFRFTWHFG